MKNLLLAILLLPISAFNQREPVILSRTLSEVEVSSKNQICNLKSQIVLEPLQGCISYIIQYHQSQQQQEQAALELYKEKKWYNLMPHPGLGYNFMINRPMVTLSLPDFIGYINRKKDLKYRIHKTNITANNAITNDTIAFKSAYNELLHLITFYNREEKLIANDSLLLQIKLEENKRLQATTEDVLKIKLSIAEKRYQHSKAILTIISKVATLENYLHRSFKISFLNSPLHFWRGAGGEVDISHHSLPLISEQTLPFISGQSLPL